MVDSCGIILSLRKRLRELRDVLRGLYVSCVMKLLREIFKMLDKEGPSGPSG